MNGGGKSLFLGPVCLTINIYPLGLRLEFESTSIINIDSMNRNTDVHRESPAKQIMQVNLRTLHSNNT